MCMPKHPRWSVRRSQHEALKEQQKEVEAGAEAKAPPREVGWVPRLVEGEGEGQVMSTQPKASLEGPAQAISEEWIGTPEVVAEEQQAKLVQRHCAQPFRPATESSLVVVEERSAEVVGALEVQAIQKVVVEEEEEEGCCPRVCARMVEEWAVSFQLEAV